MKALKPAKFDLSSAGIPGWDVHGKPRLGFPYLVLNEGCAINSIILAELIMSAGIIFAGGIPREETRRVA